MNILFETKLLKYKKHFIQVFEDRVRSEIHLY